MSHDALKHLKARFDAQVTGAAGELVLIEGSEEVLGTPLYARKAITANRKNRIFKAEADGMVAFLAEIIIQGGYAANGKLMFTNNQRQELINHCSSDDIEFLGGEISSVIFGEDDSDTAKSVAKKAKNVEEKAAKN